jgi:RNA polymerase sigma factor (sigma-70 family)
MGRTGTVAGQLGTMGHYLRVLAGSRSDPPQPDGQLLARYVANRDEAAFAALVDRYGPLVLGVCKRVLQDPHAAEDAFQAAFLVLARRAATLDGQGPLGNWLHAVAYRTAVKARQSAARRRAHEKQVLEMPAVPAGEQQPWDDLRPLLDEELSQLPEKYRAPLILCFLEGKSHQEAARELGWPSGSMSRRMSRARELLRQRLARRGIALSTGLLFALVSSKTKAAAVAPALASMTTQAAVVFGVGKASAGPTVAAHIAALAEEVLQGTLVAKRLKGGTLTLRLLLLGALCLGGGVATHRAWGLIRAVPALCSTPSTAPAQTERQFSTIREVRALALTPDGEMLAAGTGDPTATLRVWNLADNRDIVLAHAGPVSAVAFSPDGRNLAAGGDSGQVTLYSPAEDGKALPLRGRHSGPVRALAYAPDGQTLASAGQDGTVLLWRLPSLAEPVRLEASAAPLAAVVYSPDGKILAAAGRDGIIRLWDAGSLKEQVPLRQAPGAVTSLDFAAAGNLLASGSTDKVVRVWDLASRQVRHMLAGHATSVQAVVFSGSDSRLFSAAQDGALYAWDLTGNQAPAALPGHLTEVKALVAARRSNRLASVAIDGAIKIWTTGPR